MRRALQLDSRGIVVRDKLCMVVKSLADSALDPIRGRNVHAGPLSAWDLLVSHVADEHVPEQILHVFLDR